MSAGRTSVAISLAPGEPAQVGVFFYLDTMTWIRAVGLDTGRPSLALDHGDVAAYLAPPLGPVTADSARIARELATQTARFAEAVEHLAAEHHTQEAEGTAA